VGWERERREGEGTRFRAGTAASGRSLARMSEAICLCQGEFIFVGGHPMSRNGKSDPHSAGVPRRETLVVVASVRPRHGRAARRRNFYYAPRVPGALARRTKHVCRPSSARTRNFSSARRFDSRVICITPRARRVSARRAVTRWGERNAECPNALCTPIQIRARARANVIVT